MIMHASARAMSHLQSTKQRSCLSSKVPFEKANFLLEKTTPLTNEDKDRFAYFGINSKILPPFRILNPQNIVIGDVTSIREGCHFNAFRDLSFQMNYIEEQYRNDFNPGDFLYKFRGSRLGAKPNRPLYVHFMHELDHTGRQCPAVGKSIHR